MKGRWTRDLCVGMLSLAIPVAGQGQSDAIRAVRDYRIAHEREIVEELVDLLSLPNVAADVTAIRRNAELLVAMLERRGIAARTLETNGPPYVFAELGVPGATRTILLYCHYDGQPVDPSRWVGHDPWTPVLRNRSLASGGEIVEFPKGGRFDPEWRLYARSASDDKSPIVALMAAVDALRASGLAPTSNLKFLFEGDEEAGSPNLKSVARTHRKLLTADLVVAADGPIDPSGLPTLFFGARGIVTAEITVYGPNRPLHSGHYGNWAPNPAMMLVQLLASMKDPETGRVLVDGFYDDVVPLSGFERSALAAAPDDDEERRRAFGIGAPEAKGRRLSLLNLPSLNVRGLQSGWVGEEARTIVPDLAIASLDLRLVKDVGPDEQFRKLVRHIERQGYVVVDADPDEEVRLRHGKIAKVVRSDGYPAFRTSMDLPISRALIEAVEHNTGRAAVTLPTVGGSVPLYVFTDVLKVPTVIVPIVNHDNNQHSPNENLRLGNLWAGIEILASVMLIR